MVLVVNSWLLFLIFIRYSIYHEFNLLCSPSKSNAIISCVLADGVAIALNANEISIS